MPEEFQNVLDWKIEVEMPDGWLYEIPVRIVAESHARYYAGVDGVSYETALADTLELFHGDDYEIEDWAANNLNWSDVQPHAIRVRDVLKKSNWEEAWANNEKRIVK